MGQSVPRALLAGMEPGCMALFLQVIPMSNMTKKQTTQHDTTRHNTASTAQQGPAGPVPALSTVPCCGRGPAASWAAAPGCARGYCQTPPNDCFVACFFLRLYGCYCRKEKEEEEALLCCSGSRWEVRAKISAAGPATTRVSPSLAPQGTQCAATPAPKGPRQCPR